MDKRILKTKKCLRDALKELLRRKPFDKISVTEICEEAHTGRGTFYTYYTDKYDLLEDFFKETQQSSLAEFKRLQKETNPENNVEQSFHNLMDVIIRHEKILDNTTYSPIDNVDILLMYYKYLAENLESFELFQKDRMDMKYNRSQLNAFMIYGFYGFIHSAPAGLSDEARDRTIHQLVQDLLESPLFNIRR